MDIKQEYEAPEMTILDVELEASILTASAIQFNAYDDWDNDNDTQY